ncbi:MAG: gamma carbonic anhydrase family protein [Chitinophagales bacterium]|nr:gamma carbonic anhydrase family protein [Chitinophagales bacterium]
MPLILPVQGKSPIIPTSCYIAENATVVGEVTMGEECSVWFNAVVRGDVHYIKMGNKVNVQDGAILHCTYQRCPVNIGNNVSIGHRAIVHGCTIEDNVLIGMGAIVMDNVYIEKNAIIGAGSVVTEGTRVPSGTVYAGIPAKQIKTLDVELQKDLLDRISNNYVMYASWFR